MELPHLLTLFAALGYSVAAMSIKRATSLGSGVLRPLFITNCSLFLLVFPLYFILDVHILDYSKLWAPLLASVVIFFGGVFTMAGLRIGDVSIQAPMMGFKVLFVALYSYFLLPYPISGWLWFGSILTVIAVFILGYSDLRNKHINPISVVYALCSCATFALADVIIAREAANFGSTMFLIVMNFGLALISMSFIPFFRKSLGKIPKIAWKWALIGGALIAVQHVALLYALSIMGRATALNIIYSSRGLWSIAAVWLIGHIFHVHEKKLGKKVMTRRLLGASILFISIIIVLVAT